MAETLLAVGIKNLGREIALHFARRGWNVAVASRTQADVDSLAHDVEVAGGRGLAVRGDLADTKDCSEMVSRTVERFGRVDLCVAAQTSSARFGPVPIFDVTEDDVRRSFFGYPVNTLHLLQAVGPALVQQRSGTFVQIGTSSGLRAREGFAALAAAQHALRALMQVAAAELRASAVHVAYLAIEGQIDSDKSAGYVARHGLEKTLPPAEIARAVQFLHEQDPRSWTHELEIKPSRSDF